MRNLIFALSIKGAVALETQFMELALMIDCPSIGRGAYQTDRLGNMEVNQRWCEVVVRLTGQTFYHEDFPLAITDGSTNGFAFGFIFYQRTITHQRILSEEIPAFLGGLLK